MTKQPQQMQISQDDLLELVHWARRYCDRRSTYAPSRFNDLYRRIRSEYPDVMRCHDEADVTLMDKGAYWPYAQDGMFNKETGAYDARNPRDFYI
jgi:hypothetical protein